MPQLPAVASRCRAPHSNARRRETPFPSCPYRLLSNETTEHVSVVFLSRLLSIVDPPQLRRASRSVKFRPRCSIRRLSRVKAVVGYPVVSTREYLERSEVGPESRVPSLSRRLEVWPSRIDCFFARLSCTPGLHDRERTFCSPVSLGNVKFRRSRNGRLC